MSDTDGGVEQKFHVTPNDLQSKELSCQDRTPGVQVFQSGPQTYLMGVIEEERQQICDEEEFVENSIDPQDWAMLDLDVPPGIESESEHGVIE